MARTRYTIDAVAVSQEHCASRLLNLVDTKNKSSRRARQLQSIAGGNPPGEAARLICSVPIPLLSSLWIMNGQVSTCGIECDFLDRNQFGQSWARNANNAPRSRSNTCQQPLVLLQGFESRYVNTNRQYLLGPQTLDFPRVADCLGNLVDTPFPGS
ncbi:hypothetical protein PCH_Pc18g04430 [Penicillium rubens Wisconsin 54-1255]|uniref:Uncharacterized protein n=1 Tax=Penicillium rubens (strain ATCC 28089 / DSM 1075 / NRRL 1951 / Wisconsin 54-1255) TaxID=500485 RepID=B6HBL0_PENRW|nr:hypothetical protein PCH_Pc18g04430 [Penicillium rubens Wisconsin 54-1255]